MTARPEVEGVALAVSCRGGVELAVGGLCAGGCRERWLSRFRELEALRLEERWGPYTIDECLAGALSSLSDGTLLVAGASARVPAQWGGGVRTGGVLGDPRGEAQSAGGDCETLPAGFSMYTAPGGPGLAASADLETVKALAAGGRALLERRDEKGWAELLLRSRVAAGLFVLDGTGGSGGCLSAFSHGYLETLFL